MANDVLAAQPFFFNWWWFWLWPVVIAVIVFLHFVWFYRRPCA